MTDRRAVTTAAKAALAVVTVVLLLSQIGFLLVPILLPAHVWAARRSGSLGRVGWSVLPAAGLATAAWAAVYVTAGEPKPAIWLVPLATLFAGFVLVHRFVRPPPTYLRRPTP
ncbi:MAG: hypothetical protein QOD30_1517 [Actinomycetota bacterium]|nr:hypothetical protein [Actinomycetota bacterium]